MRFLFLLMFLSFSYSHTHAQCWSLSDPKHETVFTTNSPEYYSSVYRATIADDSTIWIIGSKLDSIIASEQYLSKSEDGGKTWKRQTLPFSGKNIYPWLIHFINRDSGFYYFDSQPLYFTINGGKTWEIGLDPKKMIPYYFIRNTYSYDSYSKRIWIVNNDKGGAYEKGFYISEDFGKTWIFKPLGFEKYVNHAISIKKDKGWLPSKLISKVDLYKRIPETYNFEIKNYGLGDNTYKFDFKENDGVLIYGKYNDRIAVTNDYGETWKTVLTDTMLNLPNITFDRQLRFIGVRVLDSMETIVVGYVVKSDTTAHFKPILLKTYDGGKTWQYQKMEGPQDKPLSDVAIYGRDFAVAVGDGSRVYVYRRPAPPQCDAIKITDTLKVGEPLKWGAASGCIGGYVLRIGTTPDGGDLIDSLDLWDKTEWMPNIALPFGKPIYVSIRPYNDGGFAPPCPSVVLPTQICTLETRIDTLIKLGSSYKGIVYQKDTTVTESYKSKLGCDSLVKVVIDITTSNQEIWASTQPSMKIQPNPATDILQIEVKNIPTNQQASLTLYDMTGRAIQQLEVEHTHYSGTMNLGTILGGIYLLKLESDHRVLVSERVVVIR